MDNAALSKTVPLLDLSVQYVSIKDEVIKAIDRVLASQHFILGPEVEALEREMAVYCGCRFAVGVSSGTDALLASLMALGVGPGDEVITSPFTFFATVGSVIRLGARPVFVDIEPQTFNMDYRQVERAITPHTKAIIPVHLFGQSCDMESISQIADRFGVFVVEDAAQAIGAECHGKKMGSIGILGCFSFFPSKNLGAFGDGGIITTNDEKMAQLIGILRNQGASPKYYHKVVGGNFRLDALQAAVLRVKLLHLDRWTDMRRQNAAFYTRRIRELGLEGQCVTPPPIVRERHVFNQYVIRARKRDELRQFLSSKGVSTEIYYPLPIHLQECITDGRYARGDFPVSEHACCEVLALPIYPELADADKEYVVSMIRRFYDQ